MMFALRLFFFFLPFQFSLPFFEAVDLPLARVFSIIISMVWIWRGLIRRSLYIDWDISIWFLFSFIGVAVMSVEVAEVPMLAWRKIAFLLSFFPLYFVIRDTLMRRESYRAELARFFVYGALGSAIIGIVQCVLQLFFSIDRLMEWWTRILLPFFLGTHFAGAVAAYPSLLVNLAGLTVMRASAFFPDPHMHAFYLGLALPISFFFWWRTRSIWWLCASLLLLIADFLTFSRGSYLGLLLAFLVSLFLLRHEIRHQVWYGVLLSVSILFGMICIPNPVSTRFISGFSLEDGSVSSRLLIYTEAIQHIRERPWLGVGLGNYPLAVKPTASEREPIYAHNLWLDIAVETGLIGAVFFFGFLFTVMYQTYRHWNEKQDGMSFVLLGSLSLFFGHSLVETPLFSVQVLPALLCVLALGKNQYVTK